MHWRRKWQPTPVFLPGESQGRQSLVGCRLWGRTELDTTEMTQPVWGCPGSELPPVAGCLLPLQPGEIRSQVCGGRGRYEDDRSPQSMGRGLTRGRGFPRKKQEPDTQPPKCTPEGQAFSRRYSRRFHRSCLLLCILLKPCRYSGAVLRCWQRKNRQKC